MLKKNKDNSDLFRRSVKGGFWVFFLRYAGHVLGFVKTIVIANLMFVDDYGIMTATLLMVEFLTTLSETGYYSALIQKKDHIHDYLDTAWTVAIFRGVILFLLLYFLSPLFASFRIAPDKQELAVSVMRIMGGCFLISGFSNIGIIHFSRDINFRPLTFVKIAEILIDIVISITLVVIYRSIWAYVAGWLVSGLFGCIMGYVICDYRPRLKLDFAKARELWQFGKWIYYLTIIGFIIRCGESYFVWGILGVNALGIYRLAYRYSTLPATEITNVIGQVLFPAFSKLQDDLPRLKEAYLKVLRLTSFLTVPMAFGLAVVGPDFVRLVFKPELHAMIPAMQILAFKGLYWSIGGTRAPLIQALGKPQINWHYSLFRLIILAITAYPLTKYWGMAGAGVSTLLMGVLINPLDFHLVCRLLKTGIWEMYRPFFYPLTASMVMAVVLWFLKYTVLTETTILNFCMSIVVGISVYLSLIWGLDKITNYGIRQNLVELLRILPFNRGFKW